MWPFAHGQNMGCTRTPSGGRIPRTQIRNQLCCKFFIVKNYRQELNTKPFNNRDPEDVVETHKGLGLYLPYLQVNI